MLGPLEIRSGGRPAPIRRGLPRVLLCSLVLSRGTTVSSHTLIDHLWGDEVPVHPANALQTQIAYLRRALGGAGVAPVATKPGGYELDLPALQIDIGRFEARRREAVRLCRIGTQESLAVGLEAYRSALDLWRGPAFFDVVDSDFARVEIVRLEELRLLTQEELVETLLTMGRASEAVAELGGLVIAHPLRERLQELMILALYRTGRQSDALRCYARAREVLAEELGVEPGPHLRELERLVLMHDPGLDWKPSAEPGATVVGPARPAPVVFEPVATGVIDTTARPRPECELIGRERELARIAQLLSQCRLLTLTGPGGAGKTRLALAVASSEYIGRSAVIDLAAANDADLGAALLTGLGAAASVESDPIAGIEAYLGHDECLLILDTCERVVGGLAPLVESLLATMPNMTVLATSRRPLGLAGEIAWPVPPLVVPTEGCEPELTSAFELFARRARQVNPDLALNKADIAAIAELCRALDGLPLAIELAAAQMDILTPATIHEHLAGASALASTSGPERHRTMRGTTEWSIGLLEGPERDLLYRLAVFAPEFDLDAVLAISDGERAVIVERFATLVRNSLVAHTGGGRYRLLDTVRFYLQTTEDQPHRLLDAKRRHAEHYALLAAQAFDEVRTPDQDPWMDRLQADLTNLRAAIDWCFGSDGDDQLGARLTGDLAWIWTLQGNLVDSRRALERASAVEVPPQIRARVLLGVGLVAAPLGDNARVRQVCGESAEIGRELHDDRTVAAALLTLGVAEWATGDLTLAATTHDEGAALFDGLGDRWGATICRILRARTARDMGDHLTTEALLEIAVDDAKETGDHHVMGLAYEQYGWLCLARGDRERAEMWAAACLEQNETLGYREGICAALNLVGRVQLADGDPVAARSTYLRALGLASEIGHLGATCVALEAIAEIDASMGDHRHAALLLLSAERARRRLPLAPLEAERIMHLRRSLEAKLDPIWEDIATSARLASLSSIVGSVLAGGFASQPPAVGADFVGTHTDSPNQAPSVRFGEKPAESSASSASEVTIGNPASTHSSLPPV